MCAEAHAHHLARSFDPGAVPDAIQREPITATLVVPTMMIALATEQEARPCDVSSLRWLSHGSAPASTTLLRRKRELREPFWQGHATRVG